MNNLYSDIKEKLDNLNNNLNIGSVEQQLSELFCKVLNWNAPSLAEQRLCIGNSVNLTAYPVAQMAGLPVFCIRWHEARTPTLTARRAVQRALAHTYAEHLLCYVNNDCTELAFTWARRRLDGKIELRTLPYTVGAPARTTIEQLAKLAFSPDESREGKPSITLVTDKLDAAFSVEKVTEQFFRDYKQVFNDLQKRLRDALPASDRDSPRAKAWAHDYALQLLNRLMFLYFIQRKRWLDNKSHFLRDFWESYKKSNQRKDSFFTHWLKVLFFEVFNNRFQNNHSYFPEDIRQVFEQAPYLNGGLFKENRLDQAYNVNLPDEFFEQIFDHFNGTKPGFLERYNFTIAESTPFDVEVAVDPEMIGKVYESLVNITFEGLTERDLRGSAGIFYTPRTEIDLMCRLSLVDALTNRLGDNNKELLYDFVFAVDPDEKERADCALTERNLWRDLNNALRSITICDPACGSGSFLVGMLLVLDDLQARANTRLRLKETAYERRRRIIGEQLYGVDVMDWAVHVAELRLWLQLVVETELKPAELKFGPLLPNLSFKIRQGDSLVQEIAGINFGLHQQHLDIPSCLKDRLTQLKDKKLRFYQGEQGISEDDIKQEELDLFRDILQHKIDALKNQIDALNWQIASLKAQMELPGMARGSEHRTPTREEQFLRAQLEEKKADLQRFQDALNALKTVQDVPFVWDIAFVEIFEGDARGFDIIIGNPPYVRQEKIGPPLLNSEDFGGEDSQHWKKKKKEYKEKLQHSVAAAWPRFFHYRPGTDNFRKLDGKSDLYVYFYLHGLSLLNPHGSFCFITSNSWLDVGYGADLQEFLLKHSHVKLILDNEVKRSFAQADVNTVIVLLAPADDSREEGLKKTARFVMFKKPFEEVARAEVFKAIEAVTDRKSTDAYRVTVCLQGDLLKEGLETETDDVGATLRGRPGQAQGPAPTGEAHGPLIKTARYIGNKWGGKYLRAPDIFFTILKKGKDKLVRLGDIAEVRFGIKTGANEFFYLESTGESASEGYLHVRNGAGWEGEIEKEFLRPVIKSPRECRSILIKPEDLRYKIFMCHKDKSDLHGTAALEYIQWGETKGYHERPSFRGRQRWWEARLEVGNAVFVKEANDSSAVFFNPGGLPVDCRLYVAQLSFEQLVYLNSAIACLLFEIFNRAVLGEGARSLMVSDYNKVPCLFTEGALPDFEITFKTICHKQPRKLLEPVDRDWRALDEVVFDVLGLTAGEREAVYEAVVSLVKARLDKARNC